MDAAFKEEYYTAEEFFAHTADSEEHLELHNGRIVFIASPGVLHQIIMGSMYAFVKEFIRSNGGDCRVIPALDARLFDDTVVTPDLMVVCDPSKLDDKRCNGAPDWVVEILS